MYTQVAQAIIELSTILKGNCIEHRLQYISNHEIFTLLEKCTAKINNSNHTNYWHQELLCKRLCTPPGTRCIKQDDIQLVATTLILLLLVVCSQNSVPTPGFKMHYLVPNLGNEDQVFQNDRRKYHQLLACTFVCSSISDSTLEHLTSQSLLFNSQ